MLPAEVNLPLELNVSSNSDGFDACSCVFALVPDIMLFQGNQCGKTDVSRSGLSRRENESCKMPAHIIAHILVKQDVAY